MSAENCCDGPRSVVEKFLRSKACRKYDMASDPLRHSTATECWNWKNVYRYYA